MRVNDVAVRYLAVSHKGDHQGTLWYQPPKDSVKCKQFKLIGNLLIFYKAGSEIFSPNSIEHVGLLLIEQCTIKKLGDKGQVAKMFAITFNGEPDKQHYFTAQNVQDCDSWIKALNVASYNVIRLKLDKLRKEMQQASGTDPWITVQRKMLARIMSKKPILPQLASELCTKEKHTGTVKLRQKTKGGSTFYMDPLSSVEQSVKEYRKNLPKTENMQTTLKKSNFFTELDVIQDVNKYELTNNGDYERSVSSRVAELRIKAKNMTLPKPEVVIPVQSADVCGTKSLNRCTVGQGSAVTSGFPDVDLLDFNKPGIVQSRIKPVTTVSAPNTELMLSPQQTTTSIHGHPLPLLPCSVHVPDDFGKPQVNTMDLLDLNTPLTSTLSAQPSHPSQQISSACSDSGRSGHNLLDLSFAENNLMQTSKTSEPFKNWEKF